MTSMTLRCLHLLRRLSLQTKTVPVFQTTRPLLSRSLHKTSVCHGRDVEAYEDRQKLSKKSSHIFDDIVDEKKSEAESFKHAIGIYIAQQGVYRRGHVEFVFSAMKRMKEFKVANDLEVYKRLLEVFPEKKMIPRGFWEMEFKHFPRQQDCAIELMEMMEDNGVLPDDAFGNKLMKIFGPHAHAFRKYRRMMYWLPKFKHANPYPVPQNLPDNDILLAALALRRMAADKQNTISMWETGEVETDPLENTFIVSAQSPKQQHLLKQHPQDTPVFVEGGSTTWLRNKSLTYFVLRADPKPERLIKKKVEDEDEDLFNWQVYDHEIPKDIMPEYSVHEQEEGTILAMCVTGTSTKDSLVTWIRYLEQTNPRLGHVPVIFSIRSPDSGIQTVHMDGPAKNVAKTF